MTGAFTVEAEFVRRGLRHTVRNPDALVTALALPVIILLLFVYVFGGAISTRGQYVDYVVPGIVVLCAMFGAAGTAVGVCTDRGGEAVPVPRSPLTRIGRWRSSTSATRSATV